MMCHICKQDLPDDSFSPGMLASPHPSSRICRCCNSKRAREYNRKNPNKKKEYYANYEAKHKERCKARFAVICAVRYRGFKKQPCQVCGEEGGVQGHHLSYAEKDWLTVVWLCPVCHKGVHHGTVDITGIEPYTAPPVMGRWGALAEVNNL